METIDHPKVEFMAELERAEPAARDSTSRTHFKKCPRMYFYRIVLGYSEKETKPYFKFGAAYHKFMEILELSWYDPITGEGDKDEDNPAHIHKALEAAVKLYGKDDPPTGTQWDHLNLARMAQCCAYAAKKWKREKKGGKLKVIGVEQPFEVFLKDGVTRLGGKADVFLLWTGTHAGKDFKTTGMTAEKFQRGINPNDQFNGYLLGLSLLSGNHVGTLLVDTLFIKKPTKQKPSPDPEIEIYAVSKTEKELKRFEDETIWWEGLINESREKDFWPMNETHCWNCIYRAVCSKGTENAQMNQLRTRYKREPWDYKTIGEKYNG